MAARFPHSTRVLTLGTLLLASLPRIAGAQDPGQVLCRYFRAGELETGDPASAARGVIVVRLLRTEDSREVAAFGLVRVRASQDAVLSYLLDLDRSLGSTGRKFGSFGDPPRPEDVAGVSFDESEYRDLRDCRPGDCHFKLAASAMQMFAQQVDWSAQDAKAQVDARLREGLLQSVREYRKRGDRAFLTYDDQGGVRPHDVFAGLATQMSGWLEYPPELRRYLTGYPLGRLEGVREVLYWTENRLPKIRPTLTLDHLVAYVPNGPADAAFLARRQLYASHYLNGAFELFAIVKQGAGEGTFLLVVHLLRFDQLPGGVLNLRGKVQERLQEALRSNLERYRLAVESTGARSTKTEREGP